MSRDHHADPATRLALTGAYRPPLEGLGATLDSLITAAVG